MSTNNWTKKYKKLMKLTKDELIGYIYLSELARDSRAYSVIHPSEKTKKRFMYFIDYESNRWQALKLLFKHSANILKFILKQS